MIEARTTLSWNGARWWKVDLHAHTPASDDYGKGPSQRELREREPREWLLDYMSAGVDCVAVTDHNSGGWVDRLRQAVLDLEAQQPPGYRPLHLFPGVEISVHGGVHLLAVLPRDKTTSDIDSLLGAVGFSGTKGSSGEVTSRSFGEVVAEVLRVGGIAIPAHVDSHNGLFKLQGSTLSQALDVDGLFAMEIVDSTFEKPAIYTEKKLRWTEILGSDSHHPPDGAGSRFPGSQFTWVKMGTPSLEGLRLALIDGPLSMCRSDAGTADPNRHAPSILESVEVTDARYMGRVEPFRVGLNPWLNAVIGGRGTGKSSLVEFLRLALRREDEVPEALQTDLEKYTKIATGRDDGGLLTGNAEIRVVYSKDGSRFRIQWSPGGELPPIEEWVDGAWSRAEGDVAQRFPVRMYSQKQIFHLASTPLALLKVVDDAPEVSRRAWEDRWKEEEARFLSLRARAREIEAGLSEEPRLKGELSDVERKLEIFEDVGHAEILKAFQRRRRQQQAVESWQESWIDTGERVRRLASELVPDPLDSTTFDSESEADGGLLEIATATRNRLDQLRSSLEELATKADKEIFSEWLVAKEGSDWKNAVEGADREYRRLQERLTEEGAGDPAEYGVFVQRRQSLEQRLAELEDRKKQVESLRTQATKSLEKLLEIRRELTEGRRAFLESVLEDNPYVRIQVVPYGARETVEADLRKLLQREAGGFEKDIGNPDRPEDGGLLGELYQGTSGAGEAEVEGLENALSHVKKQVRQIAEGLHDSCVVGDQRFATHVQKLPPEALDRLEFWFPEDSLEVRYSPKGDGKKLRSIEEGSPGQKTAALLAFLLSYGEEPLVLDQPEDDLDNNLIYELIVTQLREVKHRRQILVVTHNPNIVVNGDAELVVALAARGGETRKECEGSLQNRKVRDIICEVMEGGRGAFDERYRRIRLEATHV